MAQTRKGHWQMDRIEQTYSPREGAQTEDR